MGGLLTLEEPPGSRLANSRIQSISSEKICNFGISFLAAACISKVPAKSRGWKFGLLSWDAYCAADAFLLTWGSLLAARQEIVCVRCPANAGIHLGTSSYISALIRVRKEGNSFRNVAAFVWQRSIRYPEDSAYTLSHKMPLKAKDNHIFRHAPLSRMSKVVSSESKSCVTRPALRFWFCYLPMSVNSSGQSWYRQFCPSIHLYPIVLRSSRTLKCGVTYVCRQ